MRLRPAIRIGLVIVSTMTIVWIATVALFYSSTSASARNNRPLPAEVAALVALLEQASPAERSLVLRAVTSRSMTVRLEPGNQVGETPKLQRVPRMTERAVEQYLAVMGGRPSSVTLRPEPTGLGKLGLTFSTPIDLELRVRLASGDTLIIDTLRYPVTNLLGLPVGFVAGLTGAVLGLVALFALKRQVAFNELQVRLSQLVRARIAMIGGISHDVRTFLTRLRLRVDRIPDSQERDRAIADIADMIRLLDDALLASRSGAGDLAEELIEFAQVVQAEVDDRYRVGKAVDLRITDAAARTTAILGNRLALRRVISNLVDNALIYGKAAHLSIDSDGQSVTLLVDDEGPGIPRDQREQIMEPFVRLEDSRNRRTGGAGLGLAVARSLVEAQDGTISIADAPSGGARLAVRLPLFVAR
ncbi:MAG TPA: ATP-binding protein [Steroidobacteraceae bacterium]|jgi:signal transduction histidine kinase